MAQLILFLFVAFWQLPVLAQDRSLLLEQSYFQDDGSRLSADQASRVKFQNYQGNLSAGFQSGALWIRQTIDRVPQTHTDVSKALVLRVGPNYLDQIEVYTLSHGQWVKQVRGALHGDNGQDCPDDMHCFDIETSATEQTTVYLRIQHQGFLAVETQVLPKEALANAVAKRVRNVTLSMVTATGLLILGLVFWVNDRTVLMLVYCGFQAAVVLFIAGNAGLIGLVFPAAPPGWVREANYFFYVLRTSMTVLLVWAVLTPHQPGPHYARGHQVLLTGCAVAALLLVSGQMQWALKLCLLVYGINPFWQLYGTWTASDLLPSQRRVLTGGFIVYILALVMGIWLNFTDLPWLPNLTAIRQIVDWRLNGIAFGVVFFWIIMLERSAQIRSKTQEMNALREKAVLATTQQALLDERSALIDMLTHELKNPLGTIRFALASLKRAVQPGGDGPQRIERIDASIRRMDDLIEHVAYTNKMERATATEHPDVLMAEPLLQELVGDQGEHERWNVQVQDGAAFRGDRQLLMVILENLITNAGKYALRNQKINIRVSMQNAPLVTHPPSRGEPVATRLTCFEISNPVSPGSAPEDAHLFKRYYRHPSARHQPGMGLGLSVVKSAAQKMGGLVSYRHEQGNVFFTLKVPF